MQKYIDCIMPIMLKKKVTLGLTRWHSGMRICLPMQGTWVRSLVWEDSMHQGAAKPVDHRD